MKIEEPALSRTTTQSLATRKVEQHCLSLTSRMKLCQGLICPSIRRESLDNLLVVQLLSSSKYSNPASDCTLFYPFIFLIPDSMQMKFWPFSYLLYCCPLFSHFISLRLLEFFLKHSSYLSQPKSNVKPPSKIRTPSIHCPKQSPFFFQLDHFLMKTLRLFGSRFYEGDQKQFACLVILHFLKH